MKVAYVAGPYRSDGGPNGILANIMSAREVALGLWRRGYAVICPHLNTAFMDGACPDDTWLRGDLAILERCDLVVMAPGWRLSNGACNEWQYAEARGIAVYLWPAVPDA